MLSEMHGIQATKRFLRAIFLLTIGLALASGAATAGDDAGKLFASGDFDAAATAYTAMLQRNSESAAANLALGTIELYRNHLTNGESLLRKALADTSTAGRAQRELDILSERRGIAGQWQITPATFTAVRVPFVQTDPLPMLQVRIGARAAYFLIDTGAPDIVLDAAFAKELNLKIQSAGVGVFAGGRRAPVQSTMVPSITLGALKIANVPARLLPTRQFLRGPKRIDGVIGTGLLAHFISTLDYVHGALILRSLATQDLNLPPASFGATEPMWLVGDHFIFARGKINDAPEALFNIDTGLAGGGVQATKAEIDAAHIVLDEAHASSGMGGGGMVKFIPFKAVVGIGDARVTDVPGIYTPEGDQFGIFPFAVAGTISHGFFRHFVVTFDFTKMQLIVQRP